MKLIPYQKVRICSEISNHFVEFISRILHNFSIIALLENKQWIIKWLFLFEAAFNSNNPIQRAHFYPHNFACVNISPNILLLVNGSQINFEDIISLLVPFGNLLTKVCQFSWFRILNILHSLSKVNIEGDLILVASFQWWIVNWEKFGVKVY